MKLGGQWTPVQAGWQPSRWPGHAARTARAVCGMLGLQGGAMRTGSFWGRGAVPPALAALDCRGSEASPSQCALGLPAPGASPVVGISCSGEAEAVHAAWQCALWAAPCRTGETQPCLARETLRPMYSASATHRPAPVTLPLSRCRRASHAHRCAPGGRPLAAAGPAGGPDPGPAAVGHRGSRLGAGGRSSGLPPAGRINRQAGSARTQPAYASCTREGGLTASYFVWLG